MRALLCKELSSYEDLVVEEIEDPTPGPGEVLITVRAAGAYFPDLLAVAGKYQFQPPLPFVPGGEAAGTVAALGEGVDDLEVGDEVIAMALFGAFAEKMVVPRPSVIPIPKGMSYEAAAGVAVTYGTSYYALKQRASLQPGETLLVLGAAGGVGLAAVQIGKAMGARVIAAASSAEKLEAAREAGADEGIHYVDEPLSQRVKELTGGAGADVVYDPVGGAASESAFRATAWEGRLLVVGFASGEIPKMPLNLALLKGASLVGVFWGTWIQKDPAGSRENYRELAELLEAGTLKPRITAFPLARAKEGLELLANRKVIGKVVFSMDEGPRS